MNYELAAILLTAATMAGGLIRTWIVTQEELTKVKGRLLALEKSENEVKRILEKLEDTMIRLDRLLVKHGIE
jgi:hypothetical protein